MGTFHWPLTVMSVDGSREETIEALVDTGASYTLLPSVMLRRMSVVPHRRLEFELANGEIIEHDIGEVRVRIDGVEATTIVVFGGDEVSAVLGGSTLEGVAMAADSVGKRLTPKRGLLKPMAAATL